MATMKLQELIKKYGVSNVKALIPLKPLHVFCGLISISSSDDPDFHVMCEIDQDAYKLEDNYKVKWVPTGSYKPRKLKNLIHDIVGFAARTFYVSDFDGCVKDGEIRLFIDVTEGTPS